MNKKLLIAGAVAGVLAAPAFAQQSSSADQILRELAAISARVEKLEQDNTTLKTENAELRAKNERMESTTEYLRDNASATRKQLAEEGPKVAESDRIAKAAEWASRVSWKGDLRYRHEQFDIEGTTSDRVRHRVRARFGLEAKVSDRLLVGMQIATGEGRDARSTNSTLDSANQHEEIGLDLAYVDWKPRDGMLVTLGKQKQPWVKAGNSLFFDGDVNPEGAAFQYGGKTGPFAKAWGYWLEEMSTAADSNVIGAQVGYVFGGGLTLAAGYWDYGAVKDQPILVFSGSPAGNSSYTASAACAPSPTGLVRCYTFDYDIAEADVQWSGKFGAMPIMLFGAYLENMDPNTLNTGYNLGFMLGKASDPGTWEFGAMYEDVERDAQMAAFLDSDFADGLTQGKGYVLQGAWAPVKNMTIKATLFVNDRNYDTPTEADYERLQLDLNYKF